jgi:hypothetical protein
LEAESKEVPAYLMVTIKDSDGDIVRTINKKPEKNITRFNWDLKYNSPNIVSSKKFDPHKKRDGGIYVLPGTYSVEISQVHNGKSTLLSEPRKFQVKAHNNTTLPAKDRTVMVAFQKEISKLSKAMNGTLQLAKELKEEVYTMQQTALSLPDAHNNLMPALNNIINELDKVLFSFNGVKAKASWEEVPPAEMPLMKRLNSIIYAQINSTSDITTTSKASYEILKEKFPPVLESVKSIAETDLPEVRKMLDELNAPYTKGRIPEWK